MLTRGMNTLPFRKVDQRNTRRLRATKHPLPYATPEMVPLPERPGRRRRATLFNHIPTMKNENTKPIRMDGKYRYRAGDPALILSVNAGSGTPIVSYDAKGDQIFRHLLNGETSTHSIGPYDLIEITSVPVINNRIELTPEIRALLEGAGMDLEMVETKPVGRELPAGLPPLPEGAVYLGRGGQFRIFEIPTQGYYLRVTATDWTASGFSGNDRDWHYAAPADSEVVKLNFPQPEPVKPDIEPFLDDLKSAASIVRGEYRGVALSIENRIIDIRNALKP